MKEIYCPRVVTSLVLCFLQKLTAPAVQHFLPLLCSTGSALALGAEHPHSATRRLFCHPRLPSGVSPLAAELIGSCKSWPNQAYRSSFHFSLYFLGVF